MQRFTSAILAAALLTAVATQLVVGQDDDVFLWASSGGGWRAQGANMGYANLFAQAGLISQDSSLLSTMSALSGGSWFSTQFFYSQPFFENTTTSTPDQLYDFVLSWMNSYQDFSQNLTTNPKCEFLDEGENFTAFQILREFCNIMVDFQGDWAAFVTGMYETASTDYGDSGLASRLVNSDNRVQALSNTAMYVQTSLLANSRIRSPTGNDTDTASYVGFTEDTSTLNSIPIAVDWAVENGNEFYFTSQPDLTSVSTTSWTTYGGGTSETFTFEEWDNYPYYAGDNDAVSIPVVSGTSDAGNLQLPFFSQQVPNVGQIGAASSAAAGTFSGLVPSTMAQTLSVQRHAILTNSETCDEEKAAELAVLTLAINGIYKTEIVDNLAVCTQWPADCGENDGRFMDGYVTDGMTLALNVGLYQMSDGDLSKTLRIFLTSNAPWNYLPADVLSYFETTFNQGIEPGGFVWPTLEGQVDTLPLYSPQVFDSYLDLDMLNSMTESVEGLNVTTTVITTTTVDNPAFKTKAGQPVEIFLLSLNSNIPTNIIGSTLIEEWKDPIAEMARDIADSQVLLSRIEAFMAGETTSGGESPTTSAGFMMRAGWVISSFFLVVVMWA